MDYIYILAPIFLTLLIFALTVGYFLFVKHRANKYLSTLRKRMILEHCNPSFVAKKPDVITHPEPFLGVYREPSIPYLHQGYNGNNFYQTQMDDNNGQRSLGSLDDNSDVIEIPFHSNLPRSSSSSQGTDNYYARSHYQNNYRTIEEENDEFDQNHVPIGYDEYVFDNEFGPNNGYNSQNGRHYQPKSNRPY